MQIQKINNYNSITNQNSKPAFKANFANTKEFKEVVQYAKDNNCLRTLLGSLCDLATANKGTIRIFHGTTPDGHIFSNFKMGKRSLVNPASDAKSPAEATFNAIIELSMLGKKFKSLSGFKNIECNITPELIFKHFTD